MGLEDISLDGNIVLDDELTENDKKRLWLVKRKRCCGACPKMECARRCTSLFDTDVVCASHNYDAVLPKTRCDIFSALQPSEFKHINPLVLEAAHQQGIVLPPGLLAA